MESRSFLPRAKKLWFSLWGLVFFLGVSINFAEIVCRAVFNFSVDLMYDLPVWLTIWSVMMLAGPILPDGDHVSIDLVRAYTKGAPRKICECINCLATIAFGVVIAWGGILYIERCYSYGMKIVRVISVPRWIVEGCVPIGMILFTVFAIYHFIIVLKTSYKE